MLFCYSDSHFIFCYSLAGQLLFGVAKLNGQVLGQFTLMVQAKHEFKLFLIMQYRTMCVIRVKCLDGKTLIVVIHKLGQKGVGLFDRPVQ